MKERKQFVGNIIPNVWYSIFKAANKPDLVAITLLSEICFKHKVGEMREEKWQVGYKYFEAKFGLSRSQIRDAFIRLERQEVISREVVTQTRGYQKYGGVLYIKLNVQKLFLLQEKNFVSCAKIQNPPIEKSEAINKNTNDYYLNERDLEKLNSALSTPMTLADWNERIREMHLKYPKLLFPSKACLIAYMQKACKSFASKPTPLAEPVLPNIPESCGQEAVEIKMKHKLFNLYGAKLYNSWFSKLKVESISSGTCFVSLPTKFMQRWIQENYLEVILSCLKEVDGLVSQVSFLVESRT
jgi:hypothetical protein